MKKSNEWYTCTSCGAQQQSLWHAGYGERLCICCLLERHFKKCDECGNTEAETLYSYDEKTICEECLLKKFREVE